MTTSNRNLPLSSVPVISTQYDKDKERLLLQLKNGKQVVLNDIKLEENTFVQEKDMPSCSKWYMPFVSLCSASALVMSFVALMNSFH